LATLFNLDAMGWLVENVVGSAVVILVVLFQADIRNALAQVGLTTMRPQLSLAEQAGLIEELTLAAFTMAHRRIGALIVLERETGLRNYIERGKAIQAVPTLELLLSIFHTGSPLHDGAAIIDREGRLAAARCILPLSPSSAARPYMGTRHRAALGLSEETDALVIVVSEERGEVSLVFRGRLTENLERTALTNLITQTLRMTREHDAIPETPAEAQSA
jgi:diadenylate cyclase